MVLCAITGFGGHCLGNFISSEMLEGLDVGEEISEDSEALEGLAVGKEISSEVLEGLDVGGEVSEDSEML